MTREVMGPQGEPSLLFVKLLSDIYAFPHTLGLLLALGRFFFRWVAVSGGTQLLRVLSAQPR